MTDFPVAERAAVAALRAWNAVPADYPFEWPKDFPEGSRQAWMRVVDSVGRSFRDDPIRTDPSFLASLLHLPRCRDCADRFGICDTGLPCEQELRVRAFKYVIERINYVRAHPELFPGLNVDVTFTFSPEVKA